MKIILQFSIDNCKLPLDYRPTILSFFKKTLSEASNGQYYDKYYLNPERRNFTFAVNLPKPKFSKSEIILAENEFQIIFSTFDRNTGYIFMSAFIAQIGKKFSAPLENTCVLKSVTQGGEKDVTSSSALIKMQSPLCLREHTREGNKDIYISIADDRFEEKAHSILKSQLIAEGFDESIASTIQIHPINAKKTVVRHYDNFIECSLGDFVINADKSVINYLLKSGIGSRKSSGFGYARLIAEG